MNKSVDIEKLQEAINLMDCYSQDGFGEIEIIARLALVYMEHPSAHRHTDYIATVLGAIARRAEDLANCISCTAEEVGCNYQDKAWHRRLDAAHAAREAQS